MRFLLQFLFLQVALGTAINIHIDIEEGGVGMLESSSILSNDFEDYDEPSIDMETLTEISGDWSQQPISINRDYDYGTPRGGVVCSGDKYKQARLDEGILKGIELLQSGHMIGNGNYPHVFKNDEKIPFPECVDGASKKYEFPIVREGWYKDTMDPGKDRVIFLWKKGFKAVYCGAITHVDKKSFKSCTKGF
ncbi:hypothetical protein CNMCM8980_005278 [Aspergillus fumigatiaffinis]|uniref:ribonuclease T1 n=1 Tax=Aspergillus fumigatiaffinis TaxID=340414 RepID=A0A8H4HA40_9EURO|nr:hypothetical protein CNMCM5878_007176 [Aspergillus fumigatiaffinis]KAF4223587.1 hypothetical protein CNMCM6457_000155 [Aspergillus fumigatiaffinis]KAF4238584.1 hypothetical protein CNMCM6805_006256 [Aspergillus fumigatiaffinis]KAF4248711.1 hypothetical protein CNMCM8980_005278 [Aspergillus fumigatiaffinis]